MIARALADKRLVVCVGPGGVGKTSFAAALGIAAAREGRAVFVLTVDPARRLAAALGVPLDDAGARVASFGRRGEVHAAMLETHSSWDAFVARVAEDRELRSAILANRVYRAFSRTLARSHAYVAIERIHQLLVERDHAGAPRWDLIVLDTPPTRSALDVLDAPARLARFADERVVAMLAGGMERGRGLGGVAVRRGLALLLGADLAGELAAFLATFAPLRAGFAERARAVHQALESGSSAFVLVAAPAAGHLDDAAVLHAQLRVRGIAIESVVFNRAFTAASGLPLPAIAAGRAWEPGAALSLLDGAPTFERAEIEAMLEDAARVRHDALADDARWYAAIDEFLCTREIAGPSYLLPSLLREPCSVTELLALVDAARAP